MPPTVPEELGRRLARAFAEYHEARTRACGALPGNPYGCETRRFGPAVAVKADSEFLCRKNQVEGLDEAGADRLEEILAFFGTGGIGRGITVFPGDQTPALERRLADDGFACQPGGGCHLLAAPELVLPAPPPGIAVSPASPDDLPLYFALHLDGFAVPDEQRADERAVEGAEYTLPGCRLYLATVDGIPAAVASMQLFGDVALLIAAATLSPFRRHGCQTALTARRLADAARVGCRWMAGTGSNPVTRRNQERLGFRAVLLGDTCWRRP